MVNKFTKTIETFGPFENNPTFAVGVSGGIDSTALVLMMHQWAAKLNGRVIALTVNHNLRPESGAEANQVKSLLNQHGIEHHILNWEHDKISSNIHQKARLARLQLLTDWCREHNVLHLCLAHIKSDLAETFLMNSLRGSGLYGLASIARSTVYNKTAIYRPLLDFTKEELKQYLTERQVTWIEDPSNQNTKFFRTNVRNLLSTPDLALNRLALSAKNLGRARHYMETECALASARIVNIFPEGYLTIKLQEFKALHEELALYLLSSCLITISGKSHYKPRLGSLEGSYKSAMNSKPSTLWGCEIKIKGKLIYIYREGRGCTRPLPKPAPDDEMQGGTERRTGAYSMLSEDSSTVPTQQIASGAEFRKRSTVEQINQYTWIWDNRFKIVAKNPDVIRSITSYSTLSSLPKKFDYRVKPVPKKIYYSLPAIILQDGTVKVAFLDSLEELGIKITFEPSRPLAKAKFDY